MKKCLECSKKTFGQQERYLAVTKSIFNERLKCTGTPWLRNIDITMAVPKIVRKVSGIIEKGMCQTYYKQHKGVFHRCGNKSRHHMKRAVSGNMSCLLWASGKMWSNLVVEIQLIGSVSMILIQESGV